MSRLLTREDAPSIREHGWDVYDFTHSRTGTPTRQLPTLFYEVARPSADYAYAEGHLANPRAGNTRLFGRSRKAVPA